MIEAAAKWFAVSGKGLIETEFTAQTFNRMRLAKMIQNGSDEALVLVKPFRLELSAFVCIVS